MGSRLRSRMRMSPGSIARPKEARPSPLSSQCLICAAMRAASVSAGLVGSRLRIGLPDASLLLFLAALRLPQLDKPAFAIAIRQMAHQIALLHAGQRTRHAVDRIEDRSKRAEREVEIGAHTR